MVPAQAFALVSYDTVRRCQRDAGRGPPEPSDPEVLLLRFPTPWGNDVAIDRAVLELTLVDEPMLDRAAKEALEVARIVEPWDASSESTQQRPPRLSSRVAAFDLAWHAVGTPLRADVTAIIRRWQSGRPDDQGIAVVASLGTARGARRIRSAIRGLVPRLDVYLR